MLYAEHIEIPGNERSRRRYLARCYDLASCVHALCVHGGAGPSRSCSAASATFSALTPVMQRWSIGHSRSRQGLHSACSRTTRASGPVGPVVVSSVAPNTATVGMH